MMNSTAKTNRQTKGSRSKGPLLHVLPSCRCDRNNKGTWKKLASGPQADNSPDRSHSTIAGPCKQEHVCMLCNMQQSSCNYIPPGVSRLQQSGVFFSCQFWQISSKHAHLEREPIIWRRSSPGWNGASDKNMWVIRLDVVMLRNDQKWSHVFVPCSLMGRSERRALPRINRREKSSAEVWSESGRRGARDLKWFQKWMSFKGMNNGDHCT